jgi:hypothetical protein
VTYRPAPALSHTMLYKLSPAGLDEAATGPYVFAVSGRSDDVLDQEPPVD